MQLIAAIKSVAAYVQTSPPGLSIYVEGEASSTKWSNPQLGPWFSNPADGIQDLDFKAEPPSPGTIVTTGMTKIEITPPPLIPCD